MHVGFWVKFDMLLQGKSFLLLSCVITLAYSDKPRLKLTKVGSKCPCWWDMEGKLIDPKTDKPFVCACCNPGGRQCGYPMHKWCTDDRGGIAVGCEGKLATKGISFWLSIFDFRDQ